MLNKTLTSHAISDSGSHTFPETLAGQRSLTVIEALDV